MTGRARCVYCGHPCRYDARTCQYHADLARLEGEMMPPMRDELTRATRKNAEHRFQPTCGKCAEVNKASAKRCRKCGSELYLRPRSKQASGR